MTKAFHPISPYTVMYVNGEGYYLAREGEAIRERMRRFRKACWQTYKGARNAAIMLNAGLGLV